MGGKKRKLGLAEALASSTEEFIELIVRTDPNPDDCVAGPLSNGAILFIDANRPNVVITTKLLESKRRMIGILRE